MPGSYEKPCKHEHEVCPALGFQDVEVCVPVEIKPFAKIGKICTECIGKPVIDRSGKHCEGRPREVCKFTISQKIRVEVPVIFGAKTEVGEAEIECKHHGFPCGIEKEEAVMEDYKTEEDMFRGMIG
jgi:hypothetical protein